MRIEEHVIRHFVRLLYAELSQRKRDCADCDLSCLPKLLDGRLGGLGGLELCKSEQAKRVSCKSERS